MTRPSRRSSAVLPEGMPSLKLNESPRRAEWERPGWGFAQCLDSGLACLTRPGKPLARSISDRLAVASEVAGPEVSVAKFVDRLSATVGNGAGIGDRDIVAATS